METIAYKLPCFRLSYNVWCDKINQCIDEIDPNNFKSHGAIFAIFFTQKTPYFLERTHKILTQRTSPAARCRPLAVTNEAFESRDWRERALTFSIVSGRWRHAGGTRAGSRPAFKADVSQLRRRCASATREGSRRGLDRSSSYRTRGRNAGGAPADARSLPWARCTLADR